MSQQYQNIIKNVLINQTGNKLRLVDIVYDSRFIEIRSKTDQLYDWDDIKTKELRDEVINRKINHEEEKNFLIAIPGAIDSHVHFDTPGYEYREDFEHASSAAASGGVTTIIDMPCTSIPPVTSKENFDTKIEALKNRSATDYLFWGGIRGNDFDDINKLKQNIFDLADQGVVGFKAYFTSGMNTFSALSVEQMKTTANIVKQTGLPLAVHAEDNDLVTSRMNQSKSAGQNDWKAYCGSRDILAEKKAIENVIKIAEETGCRFHIVHLSSSVGLNLIRDAQKRGINISTETCPHYIQFTQKDFENPEITNFLKTAPPVKFEEDKDALWNGLKDGTISFVVTDHAGCDPEKEKSSKNFWEIYGGIPGVEHRVPFLFSEGFLKNRLTLERTIELLSINIANFFNIKNKGVLKPGYDADFTLINLWDKEKIESNKMLSKGKYTPFEGLTVNTIVEKTYLRGEKIYDRHDDKKFNYKYGKLAIRG